MTDLSTASIRTLVERLCEIEAHQGVLGALGAQLRRAVTDKAIARWREDGAAPTYRVPGLGTVSLPVPQARTVVADRPGFAEWVGCNYPTEVAAGIMVAVGVEELPAVLAAVRELTAGVDGAKVEVITSVAAAFEKRLLTDAIADPDGRGVVDPGTGMIVDGLTQQPAGEPTGISVRLEAQAKADAAAQAQARLPEILEHGVNVGIATVDPVTAAAPDLAGDVDDASGEPDDDTEMLEVCGCSHQRAEHRGKTRRGGCTTPGCGCTRLHDVARPHPVGWEA